MNTESEAQVLKCMQYRGLCSAMTPRMSLGYEVRGVIGEIPLANDLPVLRVRLDSWDRERCSQRLLNFVVD